MSDARPLIAVLDAKPGLGDALRLVIVDLGRRVRAEPGCLTFLPYECQTVPGRFYIYEVYRDAAAFGVHMQTQHVQHFMTELPALSTNGLDAVVELNEIPIPEEVSP